VRLGEPVSLFYLIAGGRERSAHHWITIVYLGRNKSPFTVASVLAVSFFVSLE
jgi:hypothetical protein